VLQSLKELIRPPPAVTAPLTRRAVLLFQAGAGAGPDAQLQSAGREVGERGDLAAGPRQRAQGRQEDRRSDGDRAGHGSRGCQGQGAVQQRGVTEQQVVTGPQGVQADPLGVARRSGDITERVERRRRVQQHGPDPDLHSHPPTDAVTSSSQAVKTAGPAQSPAVPVPPVAHNHTSPRVGPVSLAV